ncbi:hypothetical protein AB4099_26735 [Bosea sp. 2KB_26]
MRSRSLKLDILIWLIVLVLVAGAGVMLFRTGQVPPPPARIYRD